MDFFAKRTGTGLQPDGDESLVEFAKLPFGKTLHVTVKQERSGAHHRLYWAVCRRIANGVGTSAENVDELFKLATGHFEIIRSKSQGEIHRTKSISFAKMEQAKFREFFDACLVVAFTEWGIEPEAFADLLEEVK